jgi:6-phosphogluconolactonase (cycloisomerase 2 family)
VAVTPDGRSVYVANSLDNTISQFGVGAGGGLAPKVPATVPAGATPTDIALSPNGRSLYVANFNDGTVGQYDIVPATGLLTPKVPPTAPANQPSGAAVTPNGRSFYTTVLGGVAQFDVDPSTGALSPKSPAVVGTGVGPDPVTVTPNGRFAYVGFQNGIARFAIDAAGRLLARGTTPVPGVRFPSVDSIALTPNGRSLYAVNSGPGIAQYDVNTATGALRSKRPPLARAGAFPDDVAVGP